MNLVFISGIANIVLVCSLVAMFCDSHWRGARSHLRFAICNGTLSAIAVFVWPCFASSEHQYSDVYPPNLASPIAMLWVLYITPHADSLPMPISNGFVSLILLPNAAAFCFGSAIWAAVGHIVRWLHSRYSTKSRIC